jgi:hypothetical protein
MEAVVVPLTKSKNKNPFTADQVVKATRTFATERDSVHVGDEFRGNDPVVERNWTAFVDAGTLPREMPNFWDEVPVPPSPSPADVGIAIGTSPLAHVEPHRLVRATSSFWFDQGFAPGSVGEKSGRPSGFGWGIQIGQLLEITHPVVRQHPEAFVFPERPVTLEEVKRLSNEEVN